MNKKQIEAMLDELISQMSLYTGHDTLGKKYYGDLVKIVEKHTKQPDIVFVDGDDWDGLYINGKLVAENHCLDTFEVLDKTKKFIKIKYLAPDEDWLAENGRLPDKLKDVKLYKE